MDKSKGNKTKTTTKNENNDIKPIIESIPPVKGKKTIVKPIKESKPVKGKKTITEPVNIDKTKAKQIEKDVDENPPFDTSGYFRLDGDGLDILKQILLNKGGTNNIKVTKDGVTNENVDIGELFNTIFNNKGSTNTFVNEASKKKKKKKSKSELQPNTIEEDFTINSPLSETPVMVPCKVSLFFLIRKVCSLFIPNKQAWY